MCITFLIILKEFGQYEILTGSEWSVFINNRDGGNISWLEVPTNANNESCKLFQKFRSDLIDYSNAGVFKEATRFVK